MKKIMMTRLSVCSLGVSCNEMIDTPMLLVVVQSVPANNVFKKFTGNTSQRNWSVVFSQNSVAFLENWCNVSQRPVPW